jgi:hypothetical protein
VSKLTANGAVAVVRHCEVRVELVNEKG